MHINDPKKKIVKKLAAGLGDRVFHAKFGVGIIEEKFGGRVFRVNFENHGTMNIRSDYLSSIASSWLDIHNATLTASR